MKDGNKNRVGGSIIPMTLSNCSAATGSTSAADITCSR
jgi:hypothetical protein